MTTTESTESHYSLRWNNHQNHILSSFDLLLQNEKLVDVTLVCSTDSIRCHKVVLSACSPFFQRIFAENPCKHPVIVLKDYNFWEIHAIVEFMYRGEISVVQERLSSLIKAAESLQVRGLAYQEPFVIIDKESNSIVNQTLTPSTSPNDYERPFFSAGNHFTTTPLGSMKTSTAQSAGRISPFSPLPCPNYEPPLKLPHMSRLTFPETLVPRQECQSPSIPRRKQARPRRRSGELCSGPQDLSKQSPPPPMEETAENLCIKKQPSTKDDNKKTNSRLQDDDKTKNVIGTNNNNNNNNTSNTTTSIRTPDPTCSPEMDLSMSSTNKEFRTSPPVSLPPTMSMKQEIDNHSPLPFPPMPSVSALAMTPPHSKCLGAEPWQGQIWIPPTPPPSRIYNSPLQSPCSPTLSPLPPLEPLHIAPTHPIFFIDEIPAPFEDITKSLLDRLAQYKKLGTPLPPLELPEFLSSPPISPNSSHENIDPIHRENMKDRSRRKSLVFGLDSPLGFLPPGLDGRNPLFDMTDPRNTPEAPLFVKKKMGRPKGQHSAPRGGPPRSWTNAELTEALQHVWNKKMTTSQASRIFGIPYNSLLMYVRGKYGKSLKLEQLRKDCIGGPNPSMDLLNMTTNNNNNSLKSDRTSASGGNMLPDNNDQLQPNTRPSSTEEPHQPPPPPVFNPFTHSFYPDFATGFPIPVSMIHLLPQSEKNRDHYGQISSRGDEGHHRQTDDDCTIKSERVKKEMQEQEEQDLYNRAQQTLSVDECRDFVQQNGKD